MFLKATLLILFTSTNLWAQTSPQYQFPFEECFKSDSYISGEDCYLNYNKSEFGVSGWQFLEVPIDYHSPDSKKTKISFKTNQDFSIDKKTVVYFNGGPGGTSANTNFSALKDVNVIYFNQRGAAFSRPETKELFLDENYYSSENTAHDALAIAKHLGLKKVTAYGQSYGTVPATIFGSLFPENTENVILEGVIFDGSTKLWKAQHRLALVQKYFDKLDETTQKSILKYSRHPEIFPGWFAKMAQEVMYEANFKKQLDDRLNNLFNPPGLLSAEESEHFAVENLRWRDYNNIGAGSDSLYFSPTMFNFIGCKELEVRDDYSSFYAVFNEKNKLVPYKKDSQIVNYCEQLNIKKYKTYTALDYPIKVPVYYFQGTTDGATTVENAIWHYKKVAKGYAKLILAKNGGHAPIIIPISSSLNFNPEIDSELSYKARVEKVKLFKAAVNNEEIDLNPLNQLINDKKNFFVKTQK